MPKQLKQKISKGEEKQSTTTSSTAKRTDGPPVYYYRKRGQSASSSWIKTIQRHALQIFFVVGVVILSILYDRYSSSSNSPDPQGTNAAKAFQLRQQAMQLLHQKTRLPEAVQLLNQSIQYNPYDPHVYSDQAGILRMLGQSKQALQVLQQGLERVKPDHPSMWYIQQGLFYVYKDLDKPAEAAQAIQRAVRDQPDRAELYYSWASLANHENVLPNEDRIRLYDKVMELVPDHAPAFCSRYQTYALIGDWDMLDRDYDKAQHYMAKAAKIELDGECMQPYHISYMNFNATMMRDTAKAYALRVVEKQLPPLKPEEALPQFDADGNRIRKLKIGYVSSDLGAHPVGRNILGMFMAHNKEKFEIYCFATRHNPKDPITQMIQNYVTYVDLTQMNKSHYEVAKMIREEYNIDVLVDLNGWTEGRRLEIFAAKPAPVQITHGLGFVGTTGMESFQYFMSDYIASPERFDDVYTEKVIRLPVSYLPASHGTVYITEAGKDFDPAKADKIELRKEFNLPEDKETFVYCSFQMLHKISRESFDSWMRILSRSPNSKMWMMIKPKFRERLLKRAKELHGVEEDRIVWADALSPGRHLRRAQACDLHLDSWPYNAHSTATDVLWTGVPLLVYLPDYHDPLSPTQVPKMCSRVSASLLHTLGMPQLITSSIEEFENEAVRLSNDHDAYEALRNELIEKRLSSELYNVRTYAIAHEKAYAESFERFIRGVDPEPIQIQLRRPKVSENSTQSS